MITYKNFHYIYRLGKRTIPLFKKHNRFTNILTQTNGDAKINNLISEKIIGGKPLMIARYGSIEAKAIINYHLYKNPKNDFIRSIDYLQGNIGEYWKKEKTFLSDLCFNSGFFPNDEKELEKFVKLMMDCSKDLDLLGVWNGHEEFIGTIPHDTVLSKLRDLEPWFFNNPWSYHLKGKKVLVIHPFEDSIISQYKKRELLFENKNILPEFELITIKAIQTIAGEKSKFNNWFEALDYMKGEIDKKDFDIAIIGCGAYGFPLASYVKNKGKQAIHLGGMVQWMFGIKGHRWMQWDRYSNMVNEHWITPSNAEKPKNFNQVEDGCYW